MTFIFDLETWKVVLPAVGATVGAAIGSPAMEIFKDRITANRNWKIQRKDIIERVRLVSAHLDAFRVLKDACIGPKGGLDIEEDKVGIYADALASFDLEPLSKAVQQLAVLAPGLSEKSGSAQFLVEQLIVIHLLMRVLQKERSHFKRTQVAKELDEKIRDYEVFLGSFFAPDMGVNILALISNAEKDSFKRRMGQIRLDEAQEKLEEAYARREAVLAQDAQNETLRAMSGSKATPLE